MVIWVYGGYIGGDRSDGSNLMDRILKCFFGSGVKREEIVFVKISRI